MTKDDLDKQGMALANKAHSVGVTALTDHEAHILHVYETWKDGADFEMIDEICLDQNDRQVLINVYGYKEQP